VLTRAPKWTESADEFSLLISVLPRSSNMEVKKTPFQLLDINTEKRRVERILSFLTHRNLSKMHISRGQFKRVAKTAIFEPQNFRPHSRGMGTKLCYRWAGQPT